MSPAAASAGLGVDILDVARLERALERRPRLAARIFHPGELAAAAAHRRPGRLLATRVCAKEAALKALGLGGLRLREVERLDGAEEHPRLGVHGAAAARAREAGLELSVSLSHEREVAVAVVLASTRP